MVLCCFPEHAALSASGAALLWGEEGRDSHKLDSRHQWPDVLLLL